jgi:hypothetical protein
MVGTFLCLKISRSSIVLRLSFEGSFLNSFTLCLTNLFFDNENPISSCFPLALTFSEPFRHSTAKGKRLACSLLFLRRVALFGYGSILWVSVLWWSYLAMGSSFSLLILDSLLLVFPSSSLFSVFIVLSFNLLISLVFLCVLGVVIFFSRIRNKLLVIYR